jgi:hypothetical protein
MSSSTSARARSVVFALDRWLCRRLDIHEFTDDPQCLFRIQCLRSGDTLELTDGTRVRAGDRILALHLWNEHVPLMGAGGLSLGWARRLDRAVGKSLRSLAGYLAAQPALDDIGAICADMRLSSERQAAQFGRIVARYGFESTDDQVDRRGMLRRFGDTIFIVMLVSATNAHALRRAALRLTSARFWLSRATLEQYARRAGHPRWHEPLPSAVSAEPTAQPPALPAPTISARMGS